MRRQASHAGASGATPHPTPSASGHARIAETREAPERNDYSAALGDLDKLLAGDLNNREGLTLKKLALLEQTPEEVAIARCRSSRLAPVTLK